MPAARPVPKKHGHSATPPSSNSDDDMDTQPPKNKQKLSGDSKLDDKLKRKRQSQSELMRIIIPFDITHLIHRL